MAINNYYVNADTGSDSNGGLSAGDAWLTLPKFMGSATVGSDGARALLTGDFTVSSSLDSSNFSGYTKPPIFEAFGTASIEWRAVWFTTASQVHGFTLKGLTVKTYTTQSFINLMCLDCTFEPTSDIVSQYLVQGSTASHYINCTFDGNANQAGVNGIGGNTAYIKDCLFKNISGVACYVSSPYATHNRFYNIDSYAFRGANRGSAIEHCSFVECDGASVIYTQQALIVTDCVFDQCTKLFNGIQTPWHLHRRNYEKSTTSSSTGWPTATWQVEDTINALTSTPYTDPANDDWSLSAELNAIQSAEGLSPGAIQGELNAVAFSIDGLDSLICAFEADSIAGLSDGDDVTAWSDASVNGVDLAAASGEEPTYVASAVNSLPAVNFDGIASRMFSSVTGPTNGLTNMGIAIVAKQDTNVGWSGFCNWDTVGPAATYLKRTLIVNTAGNYWYTSAGYTRASGDLTTGYQMLTIVDGQVEVAASNDGRTDGSAMSNSPVANGADWKLTLGQAAGLSSSYLDGQIAAVIFWDETKLSERLYIEGYLAHKYGITLPTSHPFYAAAPTYLPGVEVTGSIGNPLSDMKRGNRLGRNGITL